MKRMWKLGGQTYEVLSIGSAGLAVWAGGYPRNARNRALVTNIMSTKKSVCVGRFLVDVPRSREFNLACVRISGFAIETVDAGVDAFTEREFARAADIRAHLSNDDGTDEGGMIEASDYSLMSEARDTADDMSQPHLQANMETGINPRLGGKPVNLSLGEDAVPALRNGISSSIRPRKVFAVPVSAESRPITLLGKARLQSDNTMCMPYEVMFDIRGFDDRTAFKRQFILSSDRNSVANLVSTLP